MPKRVDVLPPLAGPEPIGRGSNLPVIVKPHGRSDRVGWLALALAVAVIVVGALAARQPIVETWPAAGRLYRALGFDAGPVVADGLKIRNIASSQTVESGVPILVITGEVQNVSGGALRVPAIRVGLIDASQHELHHWTFAVEAEVLEAGAGTTFTTRLTGPPPGVIQLSVRFAPDGHG
jgi:hypothetical protein